mgnify:CR=1 FL=1
METTEGAFYSIGKKKIEDFFEAGNLEVFRTKGVRRRRNAQKDEL